MLVSFPSKRELPDYYKTISQPISLNMMFNNCKTYNWQESKLWKDGHKLKKVMQAKLMELLEGGGYMTNDDNTLFSNDSWVVNVC